MDIRSLETDLMRLSSPGQPIRATVRGHLVYPSRSFRDLRSDSAQARSRLTSAVRKAARFAPRRFAEEAIHQVIYG